MMMFFLVFTILCTWLKSSFSSLSMRAMMRLRRITISARRVWLYSTRSASWRFRTVSMYTCISSESLLAVFVKRFNSSASLRFVSHHESMLFTREVHCACSVDRFFSTSQNWRKAMSKVASEVMSDWPRRKIRRTLHIPVATFTCWVIRRLDVFRALIMLSISIKRLRCLDNEDVVPQQESGPGYSNVPGT